ncbi:MAG: hypothetical protein WAV38_38180 [Xanthobacteraceae bacterium]
MPLSPAALRSFNELYKRIRVMAKGAHVVIPPYSLARRRAERRAEQLNRLVAQGTALNTLPLSFWSDVFGAAPAQDQPLLRSVHATMAEYDAVPERCQVCGRPGPVVIDAKPSGEARGWLCVSCHGAAASCGDATTLHKLAEYCSAK